MYIYSYILGLQHYNFVWTSSIPFLICPWFTVVALLASPATP